MISSFSLRVIRTPVGVLVALGVCLMIACSSGTKEEDDTQFRQDVIWCEESVAHLEECCGSRFDATQVECRHYYSKDTGCDQTTITRTDPAYTTDESQCIRDTSCAVILQTGICDRALAAGKARNATYQSTQPIGTSASSTTSSTSGSATAGPVCP